MAGLCGVDLSALGNLTIVADVGHLPGASARYVGQMVIQADTQQVLMWDGAAWRVVSEPLQAWTPGVITQTAALGATLLRSWFQRTRNTWHARLAVQFTSAGTPSGRLYVPTPFTLPSKDDIGGSATYHLAAGTTYACVVYPVSTTQFAFITGTSADVFGLTPAVTVAAGDQLRVDVWGTLP